MSNMSVAHRVVNNKFVEADMRGIDFPDEPPSPSNSDMESMVNTCGEDRIRNYKGTLSASRIAAWLGIEDQSCWHRGKNRRELIELWTAPRMQEMCEASEDRARRKNAAHPNPRAQHGMRMEGRAIEAYKTLMCLEDDELGRAWWERHREHDYLGAMSDCWVYKRGTRRRTRTAAGRMASSPASSRSSARTR